MVALLSLGIDKLFHPTLYYGCNLHFITDVITYPCLTLSQTILVNGALEYTHVDGPLIVIDFFPSRAMKPEASQMRRSTVEPYLHG